jgi:uncharacterized membrane protein
MKTDLIPEAFLIGFIFFVAAIIGGIISFFFKVEPFLVGVVVTAIIFIFLEKLDLS